MVRLCLDIQSFDASLWQHYVRDNERAGIRFQSLSELGDTATQRKLLYELNKTCSADILGRGPFYTYEEYRDVRLGVDTFTPAGIILAVDGDTWVGMSTASYHFSFR